MPQQYFYDDQLAASVRSSFSYNPLTGCLYRRQVITDNGLKLKEKIGNTNGKGYIKFSWGGTPWFVHRLVWVWHHGYLPDGMEIHHKNECKTDNRIENLELLTPAEHRAAHSKKEDMW